MFLNALEYDDAAKSIIKSRAEPSRAEPSRAEPSRAEPSRAEPSRAEPSRAEPSRAEPSRAEPVTPPRARGGASSRSESRPFTAPAGSTPRCGACRAIAKTSARALRSLAVFTVFLAALAATPRAAIAQTEVASDWALIPSGLGAGDSFRLLIVTSTRQTAESSTIGDYDTVVQDDVSSNGHMAIQSYSANFKMLGCTSTTNAQTNTNTGSSDTAAPIYWLNGAKVADNYSDLYDGSWDSNAPKYPSGENAPDSGQLSRMFIGCLDNGTKSANTLGDGTVSSGYPGFSGFELSSSVAVNTNTLRYYGLSEIFQVASGSNTTPAVDSIAFSSAGSDNTFAIGDAVSATVTFSAAVTVTGTPQLEIDVGGTPTALDYSSGSGSTALVFTGYTVAANEEDSNGLSIAANKLTLNSGMIKATAGDNPDAVLDHAAVAASANHKVDGVKPTVVSAEATEDSLTIKFSEALDEDSTPATSAFTLNVDSGTAPTISSVDIDGSNVTLSLSAAVDTSKTYTIDYTAPMTSPIKDLVGNAAEDVSTQSVSTEDTTAPELTEATTLSNDAVLLSYDEALDPNSVPDKSQFTVKVGETARTVSTVGSHGTMGIKLTLGSTFRPGDMLTVSYAVPSTNPIQDVASNDAVGFTDEAVTNNLAATAPDAPGNLAASPGTDAGTMALTWDTPWHNGNAITRFEVRYAAGTSVPAATTWTAITGSGASTTSHTVTGLTAGTEYTFEVHAVNGIDNGAEASVTETVLAPVWEFTLTDSSGDPVTELTEGGDSATATVSITNGVTFGTDQTVTLEWSGVHIRDIQGAGGTSTITILAGESSGSLEISAVDPPMIQRRRGRRPPSPSSRASPAAAWKSARSTPQLLCSSISPRRPRLSRPYMAGSRSAVSNSP